MEHSITSQWQSFREPLGATLLRNGIIAIAIGVVLAWLWGGLARWPIASLLALAFARRPLVGSMVPQLGCGPGFPAASTVQAPARVVVWFVGGTGLAIAMALTAMVLGVRLAVQSDSRPRRSRSRSPAPTP